MSQPPPPGGPDPQQPWGESVDGPVPAPPPPGAPVSGEAYPPGSATPSEYPPPPGYGVPAGYDQPVGYDPSAGYDPSTGYAPPPGYPPPPGYGPPGYGPPGYPPAPMPPPRPYDPLIGYDFSSWMNRLIGVVKRSWANVLKLMLVGAVLPVFGVVLVLVALAIGGGALLAQSTSDGGEPPVGLIVTGVICLYLTYALALGYIYSVTGLSVMRAIANDAAGQRVPLTTVYGSSLRLGWPTLGWQVLAFGAMGLGALFCILPGVYLYFALCMLLPIMAFERRNGFVGSFQLVHTNFWPTVGRIAMLYLFNVAISIVTQTIYYVVMLPLTLMMGEEPSAAKIVVLVVGMVFSMLVICAGYMVGIAVTLAGYAVTYAELRGRLDPNLTTAQLAAEANAP